MLFDEFRQKIGDDSSLISEKGIIADACPHHRIFPKYTPQFIPEPNGTELLSQDKLSEHVPQNCLTPDQMIRGRTVKLLDRLDAYYVDPEIHSPGSCFRERETEAAQKMVQDFKQQGLPAVLSTVVTDREKKRQFIWLEPLLNGRSCTPENCLHRQDEPPGRIVVADKNGNHRMACIHAEWGSCAKDALQQSNAETVRLEKETQLVALERLQQTTLEQTVLASDNAKVELSNPAILQIIEAILVPGWDKETVTHVVLGWQSAIHTDC